MIVRKRELSHRTPLSVGYVRKAYALKRRFYQLHDGGLLTALAAEGHHPRTRDQ